MSWRSRPPSQYDGVTTSGARAPLWVLLLVSLVCLALGATAGLTLREEENIADPQAEKVANKRARLVERAHQELTAATQLDAVTDVPGAPSSFDLVVLGKEERDVCVTGQHGFKVHDWYESACAVQISWYLAAGRGKPDTVTAAAKSRFAARRLPLVNSFEWAEDTGPLPSRLSGDVRTERVAAASDLAELQDSAEVDAPEADAIYHDTLTTFDLGGAYATQGNGRKVVTRMSLLAQYTWT